MTDKNLSKEDPVKLVEKYYDHWTGKYLEIYGSTIQAYRPSNVQNLLDYSYESSGIKNGELILDAGAGVCGPAIHFARKGNIKISAITVSNVQTEIAKQKIKEENLTQQISVITGDYHLLSEYYENLTFDRVLFLESLGHSYDPTKVIEEAFKVTKDNGFIYIKDFFVREVKDLDFQRRINRCIKQINLAYSYNVLSLNPTLTSLRKAGYHIDFIKKPSFENDIGIRKKFEDASGIDVYEGPEFMPAEWLEIRCQKLAW